MSRNVQSGRSNATTVARQLAESRNRAQEFYPLIALGRLVQPLFGGAYFRGDGLKQLEVLAQKFLRRVFELGQVVTSALAEDVAHRR
jgi:hypothetical protein